MRIDEESEYREGIVLDRPTKHEKGSLVNCGMRKVSMTPLGGATIITVFFVFIRDSAVSVLSHRKFASTNSCSLDYESQYTSAVLRNQVIFSI